MCHGPWQVGRGSGGGCVATRTKGSWWGRGGSYQALKPSSDSRLNPKVQGQPWGYIQPASVLWVPEQRVGQHLVFMLPSATFRLQYSRKGAVKGE